MAVLPPLLHFVTKPSERRPKETHSFHFATEMIRIEKEREGGTEEEETIVFTIITQESLYLPKGTFNNYNSIQTNV